MSLCVDCANLSQRRVEKQIGFEILLRTICGMPIIRQELGKSAQHDTRGQHMRRTSQ